jgi:hypothetical protein
MLWQRLMNQAARRMSDFHASQLVNFTWSLAKRNISDISMHAVSGS